MYSMITNTSKLSIGMSTLCGAYGVPCLTLPFCTVATGELHCEIASELPNHIMTIYLLVLLIWSYNAF